MQVQYDTLTKSNILICVENVQRRATKQLPGFKELSYSERLKKLKLSTLSFRRVRGDMIKLYKILNDKYDKEAAPFIKLWKDIAPRVGARRNSKKLYPQRAKSGDEKKFLCNKGCKIMEQFTRRDSISTNDKYLT